MGHAARKPTMTPEEFLAWELAQVERHEFIEGEVYAMAGGDDRHARVTLNVAGAMNGHLRGTGCRVYSTDMRLHVASMGSYVYPDVMVTCSAADRAQRQVKSEPTLVVEVLSPSTASYDRGTKSFHYLQIPTMREIVLIDAARRVTQIYRRHDASNWTLAQYAPGQPVTFESVGMSFTAEELFADVDEDENGGAASVTALPDAEAT